MLYSIFRHSLVSSFLRSVSLVFLLPVLSSCAGSSALAPASPESRETAELFWQLFALAAIIFLLVEGLLIAAILRFRAKPGAAVPKQIHGNFRLEFAWTLIPAVLVAIIFVKTVDTMRDITSERANALHVKVTGVQWWWQIDYPDQGVTTATDLHVPVGRPVEVELASGDVNHSFWVPQLAGKTDAIPGHTTWVHFTPEVTGIYRGECAEYCGTQHANMGFYVVAESPADFDAWVETQRQPAISRDELSRERTELFLERGCRGCHTIRGTEANGKMGPDLTHFGSRRSIAALTMDNTPANLALWLKNPQAIKPGTKMPNLNLRDEDINELVSYLTSLK